MSNSYSRIPDKPWQIPKPGTRESVVYEFVRRIVPDHWRIVLHYDGSVGLYRIEINHLVNEKHVEMRLAITEGEWDRLFREAPDRRSRALMALAGAPDYAPELHPIGHDTLTRLVVGAIKESERYESELQQSRR